MENVVLFIWRIRRRAGILSYKRESGEEPLEAEEMQYKSGLQLLKEIYVYVN